MRYRYLAVFLALCGTLSAAINPDSFLRAATEVVRVRELGRVVQEERPKEPRWRRISLLVEVLEVRRSDRNLAAGETLLIDYTVDLEDYARGLKAHERLGAMPGPQFMSEPAVPELGPSKEFTAYLVPAGEAPDRYAGTTENYPAKVQGRVFAPAAGQYSFRVE